MTRTQLEKEQYTHQEFVEAIYDLVKKQMDDGITIKRLKVTNVSLECWRAVAFTETSSEDYSLWSAEFKFDDLKKHSDSDFIVQDCSRVIRTYELPERQNYIELQGLSPTEANAECFKFFLTIRTFEQKRQLKKLQKS